MERVLFYARAESPENDFIISRTDLAGIAEEAIEQHQSLLIQSGVRIETGDLAQTVYTDGKWVCFILGQLLQNAVRYRTDTPVITLSARQLGRQIQLTVEDNGIGIPSHELPGSLNGASPAATDVHAAVPPVWGCICAAVLPVPWKSICRFTLSKDREQA